jgi:hypothetical protein
MANLTSSLTLSLNDLLSKPAGEAAAALKKFGMSAQDLQKEAFREGGVRAARGRG